MSQLVKAIRPKRFNVIEGSVVNLLLETNFGERINCMVKNCSLHGIGVEVSDSSTGLNELNIGEIIPESKLQWGDGEHTLGRLVLKSKYDNEKGKSCLGFFCIDTKVPVSGKLAGHFSQGLEGIHEYELSTDKFSVKDFFERDLSYNDIFQKCKEFGLLAENFRKNPVYQYYSVKHSVDGVNVEISTPKYPEPRSYINFSSLDYFGLSQNPRVKNAANKATEQFGTASTASLSLTGKNILHEELEQELCAFLGKESCFFFNSGFLALQGTIASLVREGDLVIADMLSHACIIDGCLSTRATTRFFQHNSMESLEKLLIQNRSDHAGCLIVTEGLFSMDGDAPNVREVIALAEKYNARVLLDEVHSLGILGPKGRGAAEKYGVLNQLDLYAGTFGKLLGSSGGFVAGDRDTIKWISYFARSGLFTVGLNPSSTAAALESLKIIRSEPQHRQKLQENLSFFLESLKKIGLKVLSDDQSPIVPIYLDTVDTISAVNNVFLEFGIFVNSIVYPAVPVNKSRFRFFVTSLHSKSDISRVIHVFEHCLKTNLIKIDSKGVICKGGSISD